MQTVRTKIRRRVLRRLILVCTVCQCPFYGTLGINGLNGNWTRRIIEQTMKKGMDTFPGKTTLSKWVCLPSGKASTLKRKNTPSGRKFFPLRVDSFSKGAWCAVKQTGSRKVCVPCKN